MGPRSPRQRREFAPKIARREGQTMRTRREHDLLGDKDIPANVYWGVHTARAVENFPITGVTIGQYPDLVAALATIKQAAALANKSLGALDAVRADAIVKACADIRGGALIDQFVVDVIQGGAGTSSNMNANEVIANRALELMGKEKGDYKTLHPNEHVNLCQSTNDVYPTAIKLALIRQIASLCDAMEILRAAFGAKAVEFDNLVKIGRTQLQDAVPMTLGQEFRTYEIMLGEDIERLREASTLLHEINLGATAIGTGINAVPGYTNAVRAHLAALTGLPLKTAHDLVEATQDAGAFVQLSGVLKRVAVKLSKICNDLRLLSSGPRGGLGEIELPPVQAGSSIMPGKVNPVIPEVVNQVAFAVIGQDVTVSFAAEAGQLQLNAFEPIIAHSLFRSLTQMRQACLVLADKCVVGIRANETRLREIVENSLALVTALNPKIGYARATEVALAAHREHKTVRQVVTEMGLMSSSELDAILNPEELAKGRQKM
ncbi:MAG: aspartate ammonia-lyase [Hyphomicrobiales bacterium]|nr:aspartate ammonia-lyase [Hyphomicrobiales bacterium]